VIELLIELAAQLVFQGLGELVVEGGVRVLDAPFGRRDRRHPIVAGISLLVLGAVFGEISYWVWPYRVVASSPYPGLSLLISPVVNGLLTEALGRWRANHDRPRTYLSTFWGGALFAFGMAGVRFWLMVFR
jgi:hypothetical protein